MYPISPNSPTRFQFGAFEVDTRAAELRFEEERVPIQEVPFRFLVALLERPGEVVSREKLRERIWPPDLNLDFEAALDTAAFKVRHALGDSARHPRFLEALPGKGYRFLGAVSASPGQDAPDFDPQCVAIAPFENRTGDPALDNLGAQAVELVQQDLLQAEDLEVASEVAVPAGADPLRRLAQATRARYVAAGAYYLRGGSLEFQAQVVDPWAGKVVYDLAEVGNRRGRWRKDRN